MNLLRTSRRIGPNDDSLSSFMVSDQVGRTRTEGDARSVVKDKAAVGNTAKRGSEGSVPVKSPKRTAKSQAISQHLRNNEFEEDPVQAGSPVSDKTVQLNMMVVRGPHWCWDKDDGGPGRPGVVLMFDSKSKVATVFWHDTSVVRSVYRFGKFQDLAIVQAAPPVARLSETCASLTRSAPLTRGAGGWSTSSESDDEKESTKGFTLSPVRRLRAAVKVMTAFGGGKKKRRSSMIVNTSVSSCESPAQSPLRRVNSQMLYAEQDQTAIIFDWDDTLFPTTYAFETPEGPRLKLAPMQRQAKLGNKEKSEAGRNLMRCAMRVEQLLRIAASLGKVVIVTLAEDGWIADVCRFFFPGIAKALDECDVGIVYAKDLMVEEDVEHGVPSPDTEQGKLFWSQVKGKAVAQELKRIYSQYEGQSWKNVVSIGDADFERLGTRLVTAEYLRDQGTDSKGRALNVRTKTVKMIDKPLIDELEAQHSLLLKWLPLIVAVDGHFDASLNDTDDASEINAIGEELKKRQPKNDFMVMGLSDDSMRQQNSLPDVPGKVDSLS